MASERTWSNEKSASMIEKNSEVIPGGVVSINRLVDPATVFLRGDGAHVWDADGNEYIDFHAGFAPYVLGHNDADVNTAVIDVIQRGSTLMGAGATELEGDLAELIVQHVPAAQKVQITNTGSEATAHAIRLSRAYTGRDDVIIMQGGYNGWHNDVAYNVITPLEKIGPRVSPGEYPVVPLSAGIPDGAQRLIHVINFNDLDSVEYVAKRHPIACMILEPILQNVGILQPAEGYLKGLRELADKYGFVLIFDEVKTGFRHAIGGYQSIAGVTPDLCVFGKAIANGYPIGAIAGKAEIMDYFVHPDLSKRVLIAGTYNAHPVPVAAAIATIKKLRDEPVYQRGSDLGRRMETGLLTAFRGHGITALIARQGSAFCPYFMDHMPVDFHDIMENHDTDLDKKLRHECVIRGIYTFPTPMKQWSISYAHTEEDIDRAIAVVDEVLDEITG